ncbi:MAG: ThiF family adenylyltransferase [Kiritimatiellae bacterium]|nr:ThiF family adenylyltransferase [Kiritimatiellia bacterium]
MAADESLRRTALLLGEDALEALGRARIAIAGLGAVGAGVAESLARSGAKRLWLADFDVIRESNLNRHPFAFRSTLGLAKTAAAARFVGDIRPDAEIAAKEVFLDADTTSAWLEEARPDVLVDAIDSLLPKTELLLAAGRAGIPHVLSCMGAARKRDPSRFRATPLEETRVCPLAQLVRKRLRKRGWVEGIWAVWSDEPPGVPSDAPPEEGDLVDRGRRRPPMGSLHACTAAAAAVAAARVVDWVAGQIPPPRQPS